MTRYQDMLAGLVFFLLMVFGDGLNCALNSNGDYRTAVTGMIGRPRALSLITTIACHVDVPH